MKRHRLRLPRQRFTPERRTQLLDEFERRPGAVAEFAATHGVSSATLFRWSRERRRLPAPSADKAHPGGIPFQPVSLGQLFGADGPWAGEVQLSDGTQVRWGRNSTADVLLQVLSYLHGSC